MAGVATQKGNFILNSQGATWLLPDMRRVFQLPMQTSDRSFSLISFFLSSAFDDAVGMNVGGEDGDIIFLSMRLCRI
jgi:hypothetical protein